MPNRSRSESLINAEASVAARSPSVVADPNRPVFHFLPPCYWMNDPNGVVWHNGYYHVFYQFNPYSDKWGSIHWGHTRSKDLVQWERFPIALWPSTEVGEAHCYSGCAMIREDGTPLILYTSVAPPDERPFEQWAATGDGELIEWSKYADNPVLQLGAGGIPDFEADWRDPFLFSAGERSFMALGAATSEQANVALFESVDTDSFEWVYRGIFYSNPRSEMRFCECPNFFPLDGKYVLLLSPYRNVEYSVGTFDPDGPSFDVETSGLLDAGVSRLNHHGGTDDQAENANYYATNILFDSDGNCVLFGWIRNFLPDQGWNGCLALPRILALSQDGHPVQRPAPELKQLRNQQLISSHSVSVDSSAQLLATVNGDALELKLDLRLNKADRAGLRLRTNADGVGGVEISLTGTTLRVDETLVEVPSGSPLSLHIFLDRTVTEVFVNNGERAITNVAYHPVENTNVCLFAEGGEGSFEDLHSWNLSSIW